MEHITLTSTPRTTTKKAHQLLLDGILPATVYGKNIASVSLQVETKLFETLYKTAGHTSLLDLRVEGEKKSRPVLIHQVQYDYLQEHIIHVEFLQVNLSEKISSPVPIVIEGEAPALNLGGVLLTNLNEIEVECLPEEIPSEIIVDVSTLLKLNDSIFVKDLPSIKGVDFLTDMEELIVKIVPPQLATAEETADEEALQAPEVLTEKVKATPEE